MRTSFETLYLFYNCYLFLRGRGLKKNFFPELLAWAVVTMTVFSPHLPPQFFYIPYHILYRRASCLWYDFTNSFSPFRFATPFSENSVPSLSYPSSYNFHTLNEIKDLRYMYTDGLTDWNCMNTHYHYMRGYNTILCFDGVRYFFNSIWTPTCSCGRVRLLRIGWCIWKGFWLRLWFRFHPF